MGTGGAALVAAAAAVAVVVVTRLWTVLLHLVWRPYAVARAFERQGVRGPPYRVLVGNSKELRHGEAGPLRQVGAVRQVGPGPDHTVPGGHGPRLHRRRRLVAPPPRRAPGVHHGQAQGDDGGDGGVRGGGDPGVGGARRRERGGGGDGGGRAAVHGAHRRRHLAHGVRQQLPAGEEVFLAQRELQFIAFSSIYNVRVPGMQYVPTKANVRRWQLESTVRGTLMAIIGERLAAAKEARGYGSDVLGLMLEANAAGDDGGKRQQAMTMDEIIDECKTFVFAGHDTTSHLLTWSMFLLGTHPEWQQRLREEVIRECGGAEVPLRGDALNKLKLVTMVLYEMLWLYGAVPMISRQATADVDLCGMKVPKGTRLLIPIAMLHRNEELWGADADAFNPFRFRDGIGRAAAHPNALLSFSLGQRSCIGQDFAMLEAKATLALILRWFVFEVAPEYVHGPVDFVTLQPSKGLPVMLKFLDV
ncbi:unnamed protein product [Miscanthus lutarioriparius]|uniref:Cytochrome P450 n=1 Tax=Miscanthus lutarioriparius TaxID=422564 RepID=A0A811S530_9POAL|nr:unnamed protein product [Miscanthus lutarioriparius]